MCCGLPVLLLWWGECLGFGGVEESWEESFAAGVRLRQQGNFAGAAGRLLEALRVTANCGPHDRRTAVTLSQLAFAYHDLQRYQVAMGYYRRAVAAWDAVGVRGDPGLVQTLFNFSSLYFDAGEYRLAEALSRRGLDEMGPAGEKTVEGARLLHIIGVSCWGQRRLRETGDLLRRSVSLLEERLGPEHDEVGSALNNLGLFYSETGRLEDARAALERAAGIIERARGPENPLLAQPLTNLARLHTRAGRTTDALPLIRRALAISEKGYGPRHQATAHALECYATLLTRTGRKGEAKAMLHRSREILDSYRRENGLGTTLDASAAVQRRAR